MTADNVEALRLALHEAQAEEAHASALLNEANVRRCRAVIALADATGEEGYESRWARAWLAGDHAECRRLTEAEYGQRAVTP